MLSASQAWTVGTANTKHVNSRRPLMRAAYAPPQLCPFYLPCKLVIIVTICDWVEFHITAIRQKNVKQIVI